jgi:DNA-binding NarL/FixJ family response regulator
MMTKALIVTNNPLNRIGLEHLLQEAEPGIETNSVVSLEEADALIGGVGPGLILVEYDLLGGEPSIALRRWRGRATGCAVLVLSEHEDGGAVERCVASGARGFLPKTTPSAIMVQAIRLILAGGTYVPASLIQAPTHGLSEAAGRFASGVRGSSPRDLTQRQLEVLRLMSLGKSNKEIAQELRLAEGTVKIHVSAILRVLQVSNRTEATARTLRAATERR